MARWIKYEEDVELGPDRWGKPHVPPLCFDSVVRLRNFIEAGKIRFTCCWKLISFIYMYFSTLIIKMFHKLS